jgi:FkbM family methyltransferase
MENSTSPRFSAASAVAQIANKPWKPPLMVDIGANVGWFSLNAAAAGGRVVAFEAMPSNIALLRRSFCANPWLAERIALFGTGLGSKRSTCGIISGLNNKGDGHTVCSDDMEGELRKANDNVSNETYEVSG